MVNGGIFMEILGFGSYRSGFETTVIAIKCFNQIPPDKQPLGMRGLNDNEK